VRRARDDVTEGKLVDTQVPPHDVLRQENQGHHQASGDAHTPDPLCLLITR